MSVRIGSANIPHLQSAFRAYASGSTSIVHAAGTKVLFAAENFDHGSQFASSRFTATEAGLYLFGSSVMLNSIEADTYYTIWLAKNGSINSYGTSAKVPTGGAAVSLHVTDIISLLVGEYVEVFAYNNHGADDASTDASAASTTFFYGHRIA